MAKLNFKDLAGKVTKDIAYSSVQKMNTKTNEPNDGEGGSRLGSIPNRHVDGEGGSRLGSIPNRHVDGEGGSRLGSIPNRHVDGEGGSRLGSIPNRHVDGEGGSRLGSIPNRHVDGEGGFGLGSIPALGSRNGSVDINNDVDSLVVKTTSVDRDLGNNLLNAQTSSVELLNKTKGKNLFSLPSVITIGFFLLSTVYIDIDQSLEDGRFSTREMFKILYLGLGGLAALVARGSEGKTGVYSPNFLPGLSKEDFNETQQLQ